MSKKESKRYNVKTVEFHLDFFGGVDADMSFTSGIFAFFVWTTPGRKLMKAADGVVDVEDWAEY